MEIRGELQIQRANQRPEWYIAYGGIGTSSTETHRQDYPSSGRSCRRRLIGSVVSPGSVQNLPLFLEATEMLPSAGWGLFPGRFGCSPNTYPRTRACTPYYFSIRRDLDNYYCCFPASRHYCTFHAANAVNPQPPKARVPPFYPPLGPGPAVNQYAAERALSVIIIISVVWIQLDGASCRITGAFPNQGTSRR